VKLVASMMMGAHEMGRYGTQALEAVAGYCDEVRVRWEGVVPGSSGIFHTDGLAPMAILAAPPSFFEHEGRARQELLEWTMEANPTHVLAIDADEFVADPEALLETIRAYPQAPAFTLCMEEVWKADPAGYSVRCDGGWCPHEVPSCYRVPPERQRGADWRILDRPLACGREPVAVRETSRRRGRGRVYSETALLHFGWTREAERVARHERYAIADGGKFHASRHLDSILWPAEKVTLERRARPEIAVYDELVEIANRDAGEGLPSDGRLGGVDPLPGA
jgi:hypothetical protein